MIKKELVEHIKELFCGYTARATSLFCLVIFSVVLFLFLFVNKASFFSYYLGIGTYCLGLFCLYLAHSIFQRNRFVQEWERASAFVLLIIWLPAVLSVYNRGTNSPYSGGVVGDWLGTIILRWLDEPVALFLLYMVMLICFVLISRFTLTTWLSTLFKNITHAHSKSPRFSFDNTDSTVFDRPTVVSLQQTQQQTNQEVLTVQQDQPENQVNLGLEDSSDEHDTLHENSTVPGFIEPATVDTELQDTYILPQVLSNPNYTQSDVHNITDLEDQARILEDKLKRFGIKGRVIEIKQGPVVTLFEYQPEIDSKISKIIALEDDLALALEALSIRIIAPVPGTSVVGFEVANKKRKKVLLSQALSSEQFSNFSGALPLALGEDTTGNQVIVDLTRMPHLLVAGSTGSGKSVALNSFLVSLMCKKTPEELRLILIDPKRLEFSPYANIAHLLFPIVTQASKVAPVLRWIIHEMEQRYELMAECGVRNISDYYLKGEQDRELKKLPYIVIVIDELADVMMLASKEVEALIARITQMARAAGIHMIVATQRPSVDVITGIIKVNFPSRISFRVTSKIDSRTILDSIGAEKLLGSGDMLFLNSSSSALQRVHGAYIADTEINEVTDHIRGQRQVCYEETVQGNNALLDRYHDQLYDEVKEYVQTVQEVSISLVQRKFRIGYNRSARMIEMLESDGIIMPSQGGKTRKVIQ